MVAENATNPFSIAELDYLNGRSSFRFVIS